jgi:hypothetical protein
MAYQIINVGSAPNDGTGDKARVAFQAINANFALTQTTTDALATSLAAKAGTTSPAFGGTPTVPTATAGTNTTQAASTAFVQAALGPYLTTSAAALSYAPLASPTFTGNPIVPTQLSTDNSTRAANTSWVRTFVAGTSTTLPSGSLVSTSYTEYTANTAITANIPWDDTIPQITEGTQFMSVTYTPKAVGNTLIIRFQGQYGLSTNAWIVVALFLDSGPDAIRAVGSIVETATLGGRGVTFECLYTAVDTAAHTFTVRAGSDVGSGATIRFNGSGSARRLGGTSAATLIINEYKG